MTVEYRERCAAKECPKDVEVDSVVVVSPGFIFYDPAAVTSARYRSVRQATCTKLKGEILQETSRQDELEQVSCRSSKIYLLK